MPQRTLQIRGKSLELPVFMPDGTYGYVRSLTSSDLKEVGLPILMMNAFFGGQQQLSVGAFGEENDSLFRQAAVFRVLTDEGVCLKTARIGHNQTAPGCHLM